MVSKTPALSKMITRGLVRREMNAFSIFWNSSAVCVLLTSKWTALELAHVMIMIEYFPSSSLPTLSLRGPVKSTPVTSNGLLPSVLYSGEALVGGASYALVENTLQTLHLFIVFLTLALNFEIHQLSLTLAILLATPRCII